jgi:hypothetical protein
MIFSGLRSWSRDRSLIFESRMCSRLATGSCLDADGESSAETDPVISSDRLLVLLYLSRRT